MSLEQTIDGYQKNYEVIGIVDLDQWHQQTDYNKVPWLQKTVQQFYRPEYANNQRLLFTLTLGDEYASTDSTRGRIVESLAKILNKIDISNFFVVLITAGNDQTKQQILDIFKKVNSDPVPISVDLFDNNVPTKIVVEKPPAEYNYSSVIPHKISLDELTDRERYLLTESKTFCMYPWMHLHLYPLGEAKPCCMAEHRGVEPLGNVNRDSMKTIWNSSAMKTLRSNMLNDIESKECKRCYEREESGFFSGRRSANKHHGHLIKRVEETKPDGHLDRFEMAYWDIRFSNLCNLRCRSCGHMFSSSWYQDQVALAGPEYAKNHKPLIFAGRFLTDVWEQLVPHIDHVEQIYFAGGEPLIMEEHYRILDELERRQMWHVKLLYNTNFTQMKFKDRYVFDYWRKFESVSVGASLDAMGPRAEYIRKGTDWSVVEDNRRRMLDTCPEVDFYISPTLSILNALHVPDFHQDWVDKGFLRHQDLNVNLVQDPDYLRVDIAPPAYKQRMIDKLNQHLEWLAPHDRLNRATEGFNSLINFIQAKDNTHLLPKFWEKTQTLDQIRDENIFDVLPELQDLRE